jgi:hypothetical protein
MHGKARISPLVGVHPGRQKLSFYGTLNSHTGQEIVMRSEVMNSQATARHLEQILNVIRDVPILLVRDRGPWHFGKPVRDVLEANPRLEIMLFPTASSELDPQKHVWKAARKAVGHNYLTPRLPDLAERFVGHLTSNTIHTPFLDKYGYNFIRSIFI